MDAGTDNGFTFTSPNWPTEPQGVVHRLTSTYPNHPASSFFYPGLKKLPTLASFKFIKVSPLPSGARSSACSWSTVENSRTVLIMIAQ